MSWSAQVLLKVRKQTRRADMPEVRYYQSSLIPLSVDNPDAHDSNKLPPITLADLVSIRDSLQALPIAEYIDTIVVRSHYHSGTFDTDEFKLTHTIYTKKNDITFKLMASNNTLKDVLATLGTNDMRPKFLRKRQDEQF